MLADELDFVIGVDTHRDVHALALVEARTGAVRAQALVAANRQGYRQARALARRRAPGRRAFVIEGTGSYGAGLSRFLALQGERVLELPRPKREERSLAKSDQLDAIRAARTALGRERLAHPRAGGRREALRALVTTRAGAVQAKRVGLCQLRALLLSCPEPLRGELRGLTRAGLLRRLGTLRPERRREAELGGMLLALRSLARRVEALSEEERLLKREIDALVRELAPELLEEVGVGPISAAQLLISYSHRGRFCGESAFARLGACAPIPASSGQTLRHRLDPGGDRQLNRALHTIIVARRKRHAETIAYVARRRSEGKSVREAIRCLKRYLARQLFRLLEGLPLAA
jgi:transposase